MDRMETTGEWTELKIVVVNVAAAVCLALALGMVTASLVDQPNPEVTASVAASSPGE